jgi:hypothetical protein
MARESSKAIREQKVQIILSDCMFCTFFYEIASYQTSIRSVENQQGRSTTDSRHHNGAYLVFVYYIVYTSTPKTISLSLSLMEFLLFPPSPKLPKAQ